MPSLQFEARLEIQDFPENDRTNNRRDDNLSDKTGRTSTDAPGSDRQAGESDETGFEGPPGWPNYPHGGTQTQSIPPMFLEYLPELADNPD